MLARGRWNNGPAWRPGQARSYMQRTKQKNLSTGLKCLSISRAALDWVLQIKNNTRHFKFVYRCTSWMENPMVRATRSGIFSPETGQSPFWKDTNSGACNTVKLSPCTPGEIDERRMKAQDKDMHRIKIQGDLGKRSAECLSNVEFITPMKWVHGSNTNTVTELLINTKRKTKQIIPRSKQTFFKRVWHYRSVYMLPIRYNNHP